MTPTTTVPRAHGPARGTLTPKTTRDKARRLRIIESGSTGGLVDARPAYTHLQDLTKHHHSLTAIADAAECSHSTVLRIITRQVTRIHQDTARRILAVGTAQVATRAIPSGFVPAVGVRRRIGSLRVMCWPYHELDQHLARHGFTGRSADLAFTSRTWVRRSTFDAVLAVYDELWDKTGPEPISRMRALRSGHVPPLAWDDDTIDDPDAVPDGVPTTSPRRRRRGHTPNLPAADTLAVERAIAAGSLTGVARPDRLEVVRRLLAEDLTPEQIAYRMSTSCQTARGLVRAVAAADTTEEIAS